MGSACAAEDPLTGQMEIPGSYEIWPGCSGTKLNRRSRDVIGWSTRPRDQAEMMKISDTIKSTN